MICKQCPLRATCQAPCDAVESLLPSEDHARIHGFYRRNAADFARRLDAEIKAARVLTDYRHVLRGRERQVFDLVYNRGLEHADVARWLGISRRVVSHYLSRARQAISLRLPRAPR